MESPSIVKLAAVAAATDGPEFVTRRKTAFGSVDPLGLRQLNFDLMDEVLPGLNNVARHLRPFVVVSWAWRRARQRAAAIGASIKKGDLRDFVDRIEVLYVLSQMLRNESVDLPGRQYLAPLLKGSEIAFGGPGWKKLREERAYSTALSAPVNYGPGLKTLGWVTPVSDYSGVFASSPLAEPAVDALERALESALSHDAFNTFGSVTVKRGDVAEWGDLWALDAVTAEEAEVMRDLLVGAAAPVARRQGVQLMLAASAVEGNTDVARVRSAMAGAPTSFTPPSDLIEIRDAWRRLQVRQVFRLALESLFYWMMLNLKGPPRPVDELVADFLEQIPRPDGGSSKEWMAALLESGVGPGDLMARIERACKEDGRADLPFSVASGLAFCLTEPVQPSARFQQAERLSLTRAHEEAAARADAPVREFVRHVFESWVLAQHSYWSVGRGLADARSGGRTLLRLRVVLDEGGWTLPPGAPVGAPRPTPDRLETALSLARECGMLASGQAELEASRTQRSQ
jgi:hypothetical protein